MSRSSRLFVGNLSPNIQETDIQNYFAKFGQVLSFEIIRDHTTSSTVSPRPVERVRFRLLRKQEDLLKDPASQRPLTLRVASDCQEGLPQARRGEQGSQGDQKALRGRLRE